MHVQNSCWIAVGLPASELVVEVELELVTPGVGVVKVLTRFPRKKSMQSYWLIIPIVKPV